MDVEKAKARLLELIDANGGSVTAAVIEQDGELAADRDTASAAAHALATESDIITGEGTDGREWFPYSVMTRRPRDGGS
jgi:hypothetical protein